MVKVLMNLRYKALVVLALALLTLSSMTQKEVIAMENKVYLFHGRDLNEVTCGVVYPNKEHPHNPDQVPKYQWLEKQIGFWPLWLAVGSRKAAYFTRYHYNWTSGYGWNERGHLDWKPWKKGEAPNRVMFIFDPNCIDGVFVDYMSWLDLGMCMRHTTAGVVVENVDDQLKKRILLDGMTREEKMQYSYKNPLYLNYVTQNLDLRKALAVWCRDEATKQKLEQMGFTKVQVVRILADPEKFTSPPTIE